MNTERTLPDFKQWSFNILMKSGMELSVQELLEISLKEAYDQGYHLGVNEELDMDPKAIKQVVDELKKSFPEGFA